MRLFRLTLLIVAALLVLACNAGMDKELDAKRGITGVLEVQVADFEDHAETTAVLVTDDGERILLRSKKEEDFRSGRRVEVRGTWVDVDLGYDGVLNVEAIVAAPQSGGVRQVEQAFSIVGPRKIAILVLRNSLTTPAAARDRLVELNRFYLENSNDAVSFAGEAFGPYDISDGAYATGVGAIAEEARAAWEAEGNDPNGYDHLAFVQDPTKYPEKYRWAGLADVNGSKSYYRVFNIREFSHEIGHNLGMLHSGSVDCDGEIYKADGQDCSTAAYGHKFDPMGGTFNGHLSPPQKQRMGWLAQCQDVTTTGNGVFELAPLEGECGLRSLRIPLPAPSGGFDGEQQFYYIGYREHGSGEFAGVSREKDGVLVTVSEDALTGGTTPALLDFTQETPHDFWDAYLPVGVWYTLPHGVQLKVRSQNNSRAVVEVRTQGTGSPRCVDNTIAPKNSAGNYHGNSGPVCGDGSDLCPQDPQKTVPGICGCGNVDDDKDGDGTFDCLDGCPLDPKKAEAGVCGCGLDEDANADGLFDCVTYDLCEDGEVSDQDGDGVLNCSRFLDLTGVSGAKGQERHFTLEVPAGSSRAVIALKPGGGDPDLYVRRGARPELGKWDCRPWLVGSNREVCVVDNPEPGTYHIMVYGYADFSNAKLLANYSGNARDECPSDASKVAPGMCGCGVAEQSGCRGGGGTTAQDLLVLEAESYDSRQGRGGSLWQPVSREAMSYGKGMRAWPNRGDAISSGYDTLSPQLNYSINFASAGRYYVWVRSHGDNGNDDSLHVGLDGSSLASGYRVEGSKGALGWTSSLMGGGRAFVDVDAAGSHVFNIWMREDGLTLDKMILTTDPDFSPNLESVRMEWKDLGKWAQGRWQSDERHDDDGVCGGAQATNVRGASTNNTGDWTKWEFVDAGGPWYFIKNKESGKYLQATGYGAGISGDTVVRLVDSLCQGEWTKWKLVPASTSGYYRLQNREWGTWLRGNREVDPETGSEHYLTMTPTSNTGERTLWRMLAAP